MDITMNMVETYFQLLKHLDNKVKLALIARLSNSMLNEKENNNIDADKEALFYSYFGALQTEESAEEIIEAIRNARYFREKNLEL